MNSCVLLTLLMQLLILLHPSPVLHDKKDVIIYIVSMKVLPPVVAYRGGLSGYAATEVRDIDSLDSQSVHVKKYQKLLIRGHVSALHRHNINPASIVYNYCFVFNGFSIPLNTSQAAALRGDPKISSVIAQKSAHRIKSTESRSLAPDLNPETWWTKPQEGFQEGRRTGGENVIIAFLDTGIWPEHPSFNDSSYSDISLARPTLRGGCTATSDFPNCTHKIVAARCFYRGILAAGDPPDITKDFLSPRDSTGHGSHAASLAAGNADIQITFDSRPEIGSSLIGHLSGVAPRARIAVYKVFWSSSAMDTEGSPSFKSACTADLLAAMDAATADGVDIINYSLGPSGTSNFFDPVGLAALYASKAGIFLAAAAGNKGPNPFTLINFQPWMTTVAASSNGREYTNGLLFGGKKYDGTLLSPGMNTSASLVAAMDAADDDVGSVLADFCIQGSLSAKLVAGKVVLCTNPVEHLDGYINGIVAEVSRKGGVGVIVQNRRDTRQSFSSFPVNFPAVQVSTQAGTALLNWYNRTADPKVRILGASLSPDSKPPPFIMDFSSRGPIAISPSSMANQILKPDIAAPGLNIWGAFSPYQGQNFHLESGTSSSAPLVAGIAALIRELNPLWTSYAIKSAILTSALTDSDFNTTIGFGSIFRPRHRVKFPVQNPFDLGSGIARGVAAIDPGLVYPSQFMDYVAFLYTANRKAAMSTLGTPCPGLDIEGRDLNLPNLSFGHVRGNASVTRTVARVGKKGNVVDDWWVVVDHPPGVLLTIQPRLLHLRIGKSAKFVVRVEVTSKVGHAGYLFGSYTWNNGHYAVRSQVVLHVSPN